MGNPVLKILYGPPGTGKTWLAARDAVRAVDPEGFESAQADADPDKSVMELHDRLVRSGRIIWITFHPSYSYEDFMEGYRPETDGDGNLVYNIVDGPFKKLCEVAKGDIDLQIGEMLRTTTGADYGEVADKDQGGWIINVTPNRADQISEAMQKYVDRFTIKRAISANLPPKAFSIPGSTLQDIREYGLNSTDGDVPPPNPVTDETEFMRVGSIIRRIVASRIGISSSDVSNSAHYGAVYRRLVELENDQPPLPVAMVIDEINRADLSRVFGELLTLIELDKREGLPDERRVTLPYSGKQFSVPNNVSMIGTMNTVDRSLSAMDFAMRRRFDFQLVDVSPELCPSNYGGIDLNNVLRTINSRLDILLGKEYRIGHSVLMEAGLNGIMERNHWSGSDSHLRAIAQVFRNRILPLLLEYFHDDWRKAEAVAARSRYNGAEYLLFRKHTADKYLSDLLPDEYDLEEVSSYDLDDWWDPHNESWDHEKFSEFLLGIYATAS